MKKIIFKEKFPYFLLFFRSHHFREFFGLRARSGTQVFIILFYLCDGVKLPHPLPPPQEKFPETVLRGSTAFVCTNSLSLLTFKIELEKVL